MRNQINCRLVLLYAGCLLFLGGCSKELLCLRDLKDRKSVV